MRCRCGNGDEPCNTHLINGHFTPKTLWSREWTGNWLPHFDCPLHELFPHTTLIVTVDVGTHFTTKPNTCLFDYSAESAMLTKRVYRNASRWCSMTLSSTTSRTHTVNATRACGTTHTVQKFQQKSHILKHNGYHLQNTVTPHDVWVPFQQPFVRRHSVHFILYT